MKKTVEPVEGYRFENYDKTKGINPSGEDVISNLIIEQVGELILDGYSENSIIDIISRTYHTNSMAAHFIIGKSRTNIYKKTQAQEKHLLEKQNQRLMKLYRRAVEKDDLKTALNILAEVNKLNSLAVKRVEVSSDVFTLDLGLSDTTKNKNE